MRFAILALIYSTARSICIYLGKTIEFFLLQISTFILFPYMKTAQVRFLHNETGTLHLSSSLKLDVW